MKVDLVMKTALKPGIGERILEEVVHILGGEEYGTPGGIGH